MECYDARLRVLDNRVPRAVFGPKRLEVTGGWGKIYLEVLHNLYCRTVCAMKMKMGGACGMDGREQKCEQGFGGKP